MQLIPEARLILTLLEKRKLREKEGLFVIEGEKLVSEGLDQIKFLLYSQNLPIISLAQEKNIQVYKVSRPVMEKISSVETPPGVIAVAKIKNRLTGELLANENPLILGAVEIQDPGNLGTMLRVVDAVAGSGVITSRGTVDLYNPKVVRSTMGSIFRVPVIQSQDIAETIKELKEKKIKIIGSDLSAKKFHWDTDFTKPSMLLIGNESAGLSSDILELCDETVKIPMPGRAESLNAAMAASVILYEALRQRNLRG